MLNYISAIGKCKSCIFLHVYMSCKLGADQLLTDAEPIFSIVPVSTVSIACGVLFDQLRTMRGAQLMLF